MISCLRSTTLPEGGLPQATASKAGMWAILPATVATTLCATIRAFPVRRFSIAPDQVLRLDRAGPALETTPKAGTSATSTEMEGLTSSAFTRASPAQRFSRRRDRASAAGQDGPGRAPT